jgi:ribosomal protein S27AE
MKLKRSYEGRDVKEASELWFAVVFSRPRCARCGGLMVPEHDIHDGDELEAAFGDLALTARRCIQCGELIDAVVLRNRLGQLMRGNVEENLKKQRNKLALPPDSIGGEHERIS